MNSENASDDGDRFYTWEQESEHTNRTNKHPEEDRVFGSGKDEVSKCKEEVNNEDREVEGITVVNSCQVKKQETIQLLPFEHKDIGPPPKLIPIKKL